VVRVCAEPVRRGLFAAHAVWQARRVMFAFEGMELDLAVFEGVSSGLVGPDDIDEMGSVIEPGNSAGLLVYENVWAAPFAAALRRGGAQLVASGRIPTQAILASLEAMEAADSKANA